MVIGGPGIVMAWDKYLLPIGKLNKPGPNGILAKGMQRLTMHRVKLSITEACTLI